MPALVGGHKGRAADGREGVGRAGGGSGKLKRDLWPGIKDQLICSVRPGAKNHAFPEPPPERPAPGTTHAPKANSPRKDQSARATTPQNESVGTYAPQISRSVLHTSPTVARARSASFIGYRTLSVPSAALRSAANAPSTAA